MKFRILILACALLTACAITPDRSSRYCDSDNFHVDARFEGGSFYRCEFSSADSVKIIIEAEDDKVVIGQPWYAFKVTAAKPGPIDITFEIPASYMRYWPKISTDGKTWRRVDASAVHIAEDVKSAKLRLDIESSVIWVSAQELTTLPYYEDWIAQLQAHDDISVSVIGESVQGRPIQLAKTENKPEVVILLGRQHPAEVTGAFAMRKFVETVLADTPLANEFRERYGLLIVPLINPDGVVLGHWRHNAGQTDLNRDWGPFTQPETQSVASLMAAVDELGIRPRLMLDFHSTKEGNLVYTQLPSYEMDPPNFATDWLDRVQELLPDYAFMNDARDVSDQANTKNYFYKRYGIPSFTYELDDTTDRDLIQDVTPVFAEEMMRVMLRAD